MRLSRIVAAVVSVGLLAGCQPEERPSPPPTSEPSLTTATSTPIAEPEPTTEEPAPTTEEPEPTTEEAQGPPEMPEEAKEQTEAGAEAFVLHWVEAFNHAYASGNADLLASIQQDDCQSCSALSGLLGEPSDVETYLSVSRVRPVSLGEMAHVEADMTQAATAKAPEASGTAVFELEYVKGQWSLAEIRVTPHA